MNKKYKNIKKLIGSLSVLLFVTIHASDSGLSIETASVASSLSPSSSFGDEKEFDKLFKKHSNIDIQYIMEQAVLENFPRGVDFLIKNGADVTEKKSCNHTLLHEVACSDDVLTAKLLVENGVLINAANLRREVPLHYAARGARVDMVNFLLSVGADIDASDCNGDTPLHYVLNQGYPVYWSQDHQDVIAQLISYGANVHIKNKKMHSPLDYAKQLENPKFLREFEKRPQFNNSCTIS